MFQVSVHLTLPDDHIITLQENLLALEEEYQAAKKKELDKDSRIYKSGWFHIYLVI